MRVWLLSCALVLSACGSVAQRGPAGKSSSPPKVSVTFTDDQQAALDHARRIGDLGSLAGQLVDAAQWEQARAVAEECLGREPMSQLCHAVRLWSYTRRGLYNADLLAAARACSSSLPGHAVCLWPVAMYDLKHGALDRTKAALAQLRKLEPNSVDTLALEGAYADATHDPQAACGFYRQACERGQPWACGKLRKSCSP